MEVSSNGIKNTGILVFLIVLPDILRTNHYIMKCEEFLGFLGTILASLALYNIANFCITEVEFCSKAMKNKDIPLVYLFVEFHENLSTLKFNVLRKVIVFNVNKYT